MSKTELEHLNRIGNGQSNWVKMSRVESTNLGWIRKFELNCIENKDIIKNTDENGGGMFMHQRLLQWLYFYRKCQRHMFRHTVDFNCFW